MIVATQGFDDSQSNSGNPVWNIRIWTESADGSDVTVCEGISQARVTQIMRSLTKLNRRATLSA